MPRTGLFHDPGTPARGVPKGPARFAGPVFLFVRNRKQVCIAPKQKAPILSYQGLVPRTGFEPAHPCERCDLNTVRLPISPPGLYEYCLLFMVCCQVLNNLKAFLNLSTVKTTNNQPQTTNPYRAANIRDYTETLKSLNASFKLVFRSVEGFRCPMMRAHPTP